MEYPLNLQLTAPEIGFAVANDEAEHIALSDVGYTPAFPGRELEAATPEEQATRAVLLSRAEIAGLKVNGRWSDRRLAEEVTKAEAALVPEVHAG